jgi:sterol desaturase/sphingolipid hydroxylase (fatty acid hydroxylase superfamily)
VATRAIRAPGGNVVAAWATLAAILLVGGAASRAASAVGAAIDHSALAAVRIGLAGLAKGDFTLFAREIGVVGLVAVEAMGIPLAVVGLMLLIELRAGPRTREPKDYWLVWRVQALFFGCFALLEFVTHRVDSLAWRPLLQFGAAEGLSGFLLQTAPGYVLVALCADFFRYWFHRAQHRFAFLWRFHAVHHSPRDLDVLHNINHPVELLGNAVFIGLPLTFLMGFDGGQLYGLSVLFAVQGHIHHMNVPMHYGPFRHILADNRYHFVHHSTDPRDFDTNFAGIFPLFDRLFGTYREPSPGPLPATGLPGDPPTRFSHYLLGRRAGRDAP